MLPLGADDDGSGSVTILEAYRALIAADFHPERTLEFHWYSAEVIRRPSGRYVLTLSIPRRVDFLDHKLSLRIMNLAP